MPENLTSIAAVSELFLHSNYVGNKALETLVYLSLQMGRPLFLEGEAGVGKTEIAKVLARGLNRKLVRLQCYEGLDVSLAVYEWNYPAQMMAIRLAEMQGKQEHTTVEQNIYSEKYLIKRPLLQALEMDEKGQTPILLIDELDRADEAFEAYLLEILSDFQISIPELGVMQANKPPIVILTSNRTREIHDALKRRCIYHWIDYPDTARELEILHRKLPHIPQKLAEQVVSFVQRLRNDDDLFKNPGVAETLDWATALHELNMLALDPATVTDTLGVLLKYQDDIQRIQGNRTSQILDEIKATPIAG